MRVDHTSFDSTRPDRTPPLIPATQTQTPIHTTGPSALGHIPGYMEVVFPKESLGYLALVANLGCAIFTLSLYIYTWGRRGWRAGRLLLAAVWCV